MKWKQKEIWQHEFGHPNFSVIRIDTAAKISTIMNYSGGQLKRDGEVSFCASTTTVSIKTNNIPLKSLIKFLPEMKKKSNFSKGFWFLGHFLKKSGFGKWTTLKPVNIFEWNFQEGFLIEIDWKWMYSGWVWLPFDACHAHFPKNYFFKKGP